MSFAKLVFTPLSFTGPGAIAQLLPEAAKHRPSRILVVTDAVLRQIGVVDGVLAPLVAEGYSIDIYSDTVPEPPLEVGERLVAYTRSGGFDLVIGIGGGSAMDLAKLAAVLAPQEDQVADYLNLSGSRKPEHKGLPKILIPTTSGTGSEVTDIAVLSLATTKDVVTHPFLLADTAIVDPDLTLTVPAKVTAATGIDALTHAVEAYISVNASPATDGLALHAIRLIAGSLRKAVADGSDRQARSSMSYGSYLAGLAFFNAGVAGVHALAYPLGGQFHISHGESNAVLLPYVMGYIRQSCVKRMGDILEALGGNKAFLSETEASYACVEHLQRLVQDVGIPTTLSGFNISEDALESLTADGVKQKRLLARSPLPLHEADIRAIYRSAFEGVIVEPGQAG